MSNDNISSISDITKKATQFFTVLFGENSNFNAKFDHFCRKAAEITGRPLAFNIAIIVIALWIITGPIFGYNDTWQLIINTATTIVTFLMVFLIQHTQNRDTKIYHVKLDELLRSTDGARDIMLDIEELEEEELKLLHEQYLNLAHTARKELIKRTEQAPKK